MSFLEQLLHTDMFRVELRVDHNYKDVPATSYARLVTALQTMSTRTAPMIEPMKPAVSPEL